MFKQGTITKLEPQKKRKNRINVYIDEEFAIGISSNLVLDFDLYEGKTLSEHQLQEISEAEELSKAKEYGFLLLSYRPRSVKEFRTRLKQKKFSDYIIEAVVEKFLKHGYLDDLKFAESFVQSKQITKPGSKVSLINELLKHGIDPDTAGKAVDSSYGELTEKEIACQLVRKKSKHYSNKNPKDRRRLFDFLKRRGFSTEIIKDAIESEWGVQI